MIIHQRYEKACSPRSPDIKTLKRYNTSSTTVSGTNSVEDYSASLDTHTGKDSDGQTFDGRFLMQVTDDGGTKRIIHSKLLKHIMKSTKKAPRICRRSLRMSSKLISSLVNKSNSSVSFVFKNALWGGSHLNNRQDKQLSDMICDLQKANLEPTDRTHAFFDEISNQDTVSASDSLSEYETCEESGITDLGAFSCLKRLFSTNIFTKSKLQNVEVTGCQDYRIDSFQTTRLASCPADVNCKVDDFVDDSVDDSVDCVCLDIQENEKLRREVSGITRIGLELFPTESDGVDVVECNDHLFTECVDDLSIDPFEDESILLHSSTQRECGVETNRSDGEYIIGISRGDYVFNDEDYLLPTMALLTNLLNKNFVS